MITASPSTTSAPVTRFIPPPVFMRRIGSPIGTIEICADGQAITSLAIEHQGRLPREEHAEQRNQILDDAATQLAQYFAGQRRAFELPVALDGTAFQKTVWQYLQNIAYGSVVSYGQIGSATGTGGAGRAVGGAVGANPVPLIVPCHRVLSVSGRITGYSAGNGAETKAWLLDHEGAEYQS